MISQKLKIGLDYHGVIDQNPIYFGKLCTEARKRGHKIYIITGGPLAKVRQDLASDHISYDFIFAISDYYQALGKIEQAEDGSLIVPKYLWNIAKAEFCRRNHINIHIDDSSDYLHWFSTPFCLYDKRGNVCHMSPGISFNFSQSPKSAVISMEQIAANMIYFL